jgi:hypothetical protein
MKFRGLGPKKVPHRFAIRGSRSIFATLFGGLTSAGKPVYGLVMANLLRYAIVFCYSYHT